VNVDLILLSQQAESPKLFWPQGTIYTVCPEVEALRDFCGKYLDSTESKAWLFWDADLGQPNITTVQKALSGPADVWHSGLVAGMGGLPKIIDFVSPTWMLNCDPAPEIEATSWRVSLRACLVRKEVIRQIGFLSPAFQSLEAAGLEWGHRCIRLGVLMRHLPGLVDREHAKRLFSPALPFEDEVRFVQSRFGRKWSLWARVRAILTGYGTFRSVLRSMRVSSPGDFLTAPAPFEHQSLSPGNSHRTGAEQVSVLIPTVERYPYMKTVLEQLRHQTHPPYEIIVIDQTPKLRREQAFYADYADLPLKVIFLDRAGQCTSRNIGLQASRGEYILFIDDDDELPPNLIAAHLENIHRFGIDVSAGVAIEVGSSALPTDFTYRRASDVFPTNNSLVRRSALLESGLFDKAYDHGARADGDLGMRLYLSGTLMVLNPDIQVMHHHAPRGGLRQHKARVITYAGSRNSVRQRHLPSATEIYLVSRYFSTVQLREMLLISLLGTFSMHGGNRLDHILKAFWSALCFPLSMWTILLRKREVKEMLQHYPQIALLLYQESVCRR
jgi:glycosyltransferase involved in cell wall biosynthesis